MIFAIGYMELETFQTKPGTDGQSCPMGRSAVTVADYHLTGPSEVIAGGHIDILTQQYVGSNG